MSANFFLPMISCNELYNINLLDGFTEGDAVALW